MQLKLPFKLKVKYLLSHEENFTGRAVFHEKEYKLLIKNQEKKSIITVPFSTMGVTEDRLLVRISGPSGVYAEDHIKLGSQSEEIIIESNDMFNEMINNHEKFDTLEIFVK